MKKILSVILAFVLLLTVVMPVVAFAGNGPYQNKGGEGEDIALISFQDSKSGAISYLYNSAQKPNPNANKLENSAALSYDVKTNTLTLKNFKSDDIMVLIAMGDDFKIKLSGYNELGCIIAAGLNWGNSITITGKGALVVNKSCHYEDAIFIDAGSTGNGFLKIEETVGVKLYKGESSAVGIYGVAEGDSKKVITLGGNVTCDATTSNKYTQNVYEQEKVKTVTHYKGAGIFCAKKGEGNENKIFIAETVDSESNTYNVAEVVYDAELKNHVVLPVAEGNKNIMLEASGFVDLEQAKYPADVLCIDSDATSMNACIGENGKNCVFIDFSDISKPETDIEVYNILEHTKYGKLALLNVPMKGYKELKRVQSNTRYNHVNKTTVIKVNTTPESLPAAVKLKSAASVFGGVKVTWNSAAGAESYTVYRATKQNGKWSGWSVLGTVNSLEFYDKTAKNATEYKYTVRAGNILGLGGFDKNGVSVQYVTAPTATASNTSAGVKVTWGKVDKASKYIVYRAQLANGKWSGWKNLGEVKATAYADKSAVSGVTYKYTVRAVNNNVKSSFTDSNVLTYLSVPSVSIANSQKGVKVTWTKVTGATGYTVFRAENVNGKWSGWKNLGKLAAVTAYTDETAASGVNYKYTVRAFNNTSSGAYKASAALLFLAQPSVKIANAVGGIKVSWSESKGALGYTVYRSELVNGKWSGWKTMGTAAATKFAWVDKSVKDGATYRYTVRAVNKSVRSTFVATAGLVRLAAPTVTPSNAATGVKLTWNKVAGASGYMVYRAELVNGKWSSWQSLAKRNNVNSYVDATAVSGATYKYTVRACNGSSLSTYKESGKLLYLAAPKVTAVKAEKGVSVSWGAELGAESYIVYRSEYNETTKKWSAWKVLSTGVKADKVLYADESAVAGKTYKYTVRAVAGATKSGYVSSASVKA